MLNPDSNKILYRKLKMGYILVHNNFLHWFLQIGRGVSIKLKNMIFFKKVHLHRVFYFFLTRQKKINNFLVNEFKFKWKIHLIKSSVINRLLAKM